MEEFGILSQLALAVAATVASVVGLQLSRRMASHEFHQASIAILQDLTTGEVAAARDVMGTFMYGEDDAVRSLSQSELIRAYYTLSWCLERVARGYAALDVSGNHTVRTAFCQSVKWHTTEIVTNLALLRRLLSVTDADAWRALQTAVRLLSRRPQHLSIELIDEDRVESLVASRGLRSRAAALS